MWTLSVIKRPISVVLKQRSKGACPQMTTTLSKHASQLKRTKPRSLLKVARRLKNLLKTRCSRQWATLDSLNQVKTSIRKFKRVSWEFILWFQKAKSKKCKTQTTTAGKCALKPSTKSTSQFRKRSRNPPNSLFRQVTSYLTFSWTYCRTKTSKSCSWLYL